MDNDVIDKILKGDVRTAARLIRDIDDGNDSARDRLKKLFPHTGRALVVGVTGSPGVGKSTLVDRLITFLRQRDNTVGVLAVDPTSPYTGGAILGDRLRMRRHSTDEGVFIRSLATRGQFGGLTQAAKGAAMVLDALGKDIVIVETVGVGQGEVDVSRLAHTTVVVAAPGQGDGIQAIKAGLMEIGDIYVVNKADLTGAGQTRREIEMALDMGRSLHGEEEWRPPVLFTDALQSQGIADLWNRIQDHQTHRRQKKTDRDLKLRKLKARQELVHLVRRDLLDRLMRQLDGKTLLDEMVEKLLSRTIDPYTASEDIISAVFNRSRKP